MVQPEDGLISDVQLLIKTLMTQRSAFGSDGLVEAEAFYGIQGLNTISRPDVTITEEKMMLKRAMRVLEAVTAQAKQVPSTIRQDLCIVSLLPQNGQALPLMPCHAAYAEF